jgi:glycosyltransferase involved in cell wall biosynthesis
VARKPETLVKIVRVIARLNVGGPAIHAILLSARMNAQGTRTVLVCGREGPREGSMEEMAAAHGVVPVRIPELGREIRWWDDLAAFWKLYRLVRKERPGILHTHTAKAGTLGRLAGWLAGVPVIVHTFHGHVFHGYFSPWKTRMFVATERLMARISTAIVTLSPRLKEDLVNLGIAPPEKIRIVPLGLALDRFGELDTRRGNLRRELGLGSETILIGIVGRLVPIKNHRLFLQAARDIVQEMQDRADRSVRFLVVGDGDLRDRLEDETRAMGLASRVLFLGFRRDLENIYADLDIVVLTSNNEGTPVCLIEAMAGGKPVVATRVGGVADLVEDNVTGMLVPPGDREALAKALLVLLGDPALRARLGERARSAVYPRFDIRTLVSNLERLYAELDSRKSAVSGTVVEKAS